MKALLLSRAFLFPDFLAKEAFYSCLHKEPQLRFFIVAPQCSLHHLPLFTEYLLDRTAIKD
jgi:hypothetical protein